MMKNLKNTVLCGFLIMAAVMTMASCSKDDLPIDEDGLLISSNSSACVGSFELLGFDHQSVLTKTAVVDTVAQTVDVEVFYGADLKSLWPQFSLITDAKLAPKITGFVDFSDLSHPKEWTVISGNRKVKKVYTVRVTVQQP